MRVGFAGTPAFAATILEAIAGAGFSIPLVLTQPDRPRGRGMAVRPSPVKEFALRHELVVLQPPRLKDPEPRAPVLAVPLDVLVVAAYGLILPAEVLAWPRHGCLNVHASLLPRWRGAAPIQRAILAGDRETGISLMQMDAGLDTGPVIARHPLQIGRHESAGMLEARLAAVGAESLVATLKHLGRDGRLEAAPQPAEGVTYAAKIDRREAALDWHGDAVQLDRTVRAFDPVPGAFTSRGGEIWKVWRAEPAEGRPGTPGTILEVGAQGLVVACGRGCLVVKELQPAGGKRMGAAAIVAGRRLARGDAFDPRPSGTE